MEKVRCPESKRSGHYDSLTVAGLMVVGGVCARPSRPSIYTQLLYQSITQQGDGRII